MSFIIRNRIDVKTAAKLQPRIVVTGNTDIYWNNVSLLLKGDGGSDVTSDVAIPVDSTANAYVMSRVGSPRQRSYSPFNGAVGCMYFNGSSDCLTNSSDFSLGTSNFTIEFMVYSSGAAGVILTIGSETTNRIQIQTALVELFGGVFSFSYTAPTANVWRHMALVRNGNTFTMYVNGTSSGSGTYSGNIGNSSGIIIAARSGLVNFYSGFLTNIRIVKGTALYTSNFTPPSSPLSVITNTTFLLKFDSPNGGNNNTFVDSSVNGFSITKAGSTTLGNVTPFTGSGGSIYFDGASTLSVASNVQFGFGTGNFTVELWVYCSFNSAIQEFIDARASDTSAPWVLGVSGTGLARSYDGVTLRTGGQLVQNSWNHVAWVRNSNVNSVYVNGTLGHTWTATQDFSSSNKLVIGNNQGPTSEPFTGYLSNIHIVKGTAIYTGNFSPSTVPLNPVSGTSLLIKGESAQIIDSSRKNNLVIIGNTQISTTTKKYDIGSVYFDGNRDGFRASNITQTTFGTVDFTLEFWVYPVSIANAPVLVDFRPDSTNGNYVLLGINASGGLEYYVNSANRIVSTNGAISIGTWTHISISRSSGTTRMFINGTQVGSSWSDSTNYLAGSGRFCYNAYSSTYDFNGYIDDLRVTKGVGRYISNFTVPTSSPTS